MRTRNYELVVLISPQVADERVPEIVDRVTKTVTERGGSIAEVKPWGRKRLAYHIKDFQEANYVQANFSMDAAATEELEGNVRLIEEVIRHLLVRVDSN